MGERRTSDNSSFIVWKGYLNKKPVRIRYDDGHWEWHSPDYSNPIPITVTLHAIRRWFDEAEQILTLEKEA